MASDFCAPAACGYGEPPLRLQIQWVRFQRAPLSSRSVRLLQIFPIVISLPQSEKATRK
jgi:hypothetical protein